MSQLPLIQPDPITGAFPFYRAICFGGLDTVQDGITCEWGDGEWGYAEDELEESVHLHAAMVCWENWQLGDYGWSCIVNMAVVDSLALEAASGQKVVTLSTPALAPYYTPLVVTRPVLVEFWEDVSGQRGALLERAWVDSVDGATLTLKENLASTLPAGATTIPCLGCYSPARGAGLLKGGMTLLGTGQDIFGSRDHSQATEAMQAGLSLAARFKAVTGSAGTRKAALTFLMCAANGN